MGNTLHPLLAEIFMDNIEGCFTGSFMNQIHPNIKFTLEIEQKGINFLYFTIDKINNKLDLNFSQNIAH